MKRFGVVNSYGNLLKVFNTYQEASEFWHQKKNPEWRIKIYECAYKSCS